MTGQHNRNTVLTFQQRCTWFPPNSSQLTFKSILQSKSYRNTLRAKGVQAEEEKDRETLKHLTEGVNKNNEEGLF